LVVVPFIPSAVGSAASCRVMTVRYDLSSGQLVVLDPAHYDIQFRGCVQFVNQTAATTTITVGSRYSQRLGPNENTDGSTNFRGTSSGRQQVTATSGPGGAPGNTAHGSITVAPAPRTGPSRPSHPSKSPPSTPAPASPPPSSAGSGPRVAPTPTRARPHGHGHKSGGLHPPVSPPGPVQMPSPSLTPQPARTGVVAGPIEPASGRGTGLPAALAALAVVGSGAAIVRVLAAEPVDSGTNVGGGS
jgi:hypothetical protein